MFKYNTQNETFAITKHEILFHPKLSADSKTVLTYVAYFEDKEDHNFYVEDICKDLRIGPTKWRRVSKELRDAVYLQTRNTDGNKSRLEFAKIKPKKLKSHVSKPTGVTHKPRIETDRRPGIETDVPIINNNINNKAAIEKIGLPASFFEDNQIQISQAWFDSALSKYGDVGLKFGLELLAKRKLKSDIPKPENWLDKVLPEEIAKNSHTNASNSSYKAHHDKKNKNEYQCSPQVKKVDWWALAKDKLRAEGKSEGDTLESADEFEEMAGKLALKLKKGN